LQVLHALVYIHEEMDICYGNLTCSDILINEQGEVQVGMYPPVPTYDLRLTLTAGIGSSLLQKPNPLGKTRDIQALCHIARKLLRVEEIIDVRGTTRLLAEDFAGAPPTATAKTLLQVGINE
jgi:hypothetical protein